MNAALLHWLVFFKLLWGQFRRIYIMNCAHKLRLPQIVESAGGATCVAPCEAGQEVCNCESSVC